MDAAPDPASMGFEADVKALVARFDVEGSPGGVVAVAQDGGVQTIVPFGYADLEHAVPHTPDSVFYIASTSKQFVAAAVAVLEADGALSPDDPVARWVPEVAALGDLRVHHLVHHTSGIRDKYGLALVGQLPEETIATAAGTMALLARQRSLGFPTGSRMMYSNSGYFLLAKLVERCSGQSLVTFTEERLFAPWGMTQTRFRDDTSEIIALRARGYAPRPGGGFRTAEYGYSALGPGGVVTTVESLARWAGVFRTELGEQLQRTRSLADGTKNMYGYGLMLDEHAGKRLLHHGGEVPGFSAEMLQVPGDGLTVICLANSPAVDAVAVARAVLDLIMPSEQRATRRATAPVRLAEEILGSYIDTDDSMLLTVNAAEGGLLLSLAGLSLPVTLEETGWRSATGIPIDFQDDRVTVNVPGQQLAFTRIQPGSPSATEFCGRYVSDELLASLVVSQAADGLLLAWHDREPLELRPIGNDVLIVSVDSPSPVELVVRIRREQDVITGLSIGTNRAPGNVFAKR